MVERREKDGEADRKQVCNKSDLKTIESEGKREREKDRVRRWKERYS